MQNGQIPTCQGQGDAPEIRLKRTKHWKSNKGEPTLQKRKLAGALGGA